MSKAKETAISSVDDSMDYISQGITTNIRLQRNKNKISVHTA